MRNLSPLGAIHSPIDSDRDPSAYTTDFKALGLTDHSPFDILGRERAAIKPSAELKKRGPKPRRTKLQQTLAALEDPKQNPFNVGIATREESDRTNSIRGAAC